MQRRRRPSAGSPAHSRDTRAQGVPGEEGTGLQRELARIGQRIRRWREESELTLQKLAEQSSVATSTIQKVETGQMVPTVAVLMKIARGLGRRPSELISDEPPDIEVAHLRAKERYALGSRQNVRVERLSGDLFEPSIEVRRVTVQPGYGSGKGTFALEGEEVLVCEDGSIELEIGSEVYELQSGDSMHFKAALPHAWRNVGDVAASFLVACDFPRQFQAVLQRNLKSGRRR